MKGKTGDAYYMAGLAGYKHSIYSGVKSAIRGLLFKFVILSHCSFDTAFIPY